METGPPEIEFTGIVRPNKRRMPQLADDASDRASLTSTRASDDSNLLKNNSLSDWPGLKAQDSVLKPLLKDVTTTSISNPAAGFSNSVSDSDPGPPNRIDSTFTKAPNSTITSQSGGLITRTPLLPSSSRTTKPRPQSEITPVARAIEDGPIWLNARSSTTMESIRHFVSKTQNSARSWGDDNTTNLKMALRHGLRPFIKPRLEDQLRIATHPSNRARCHFLPKDQLVRLVTEKSINKELSRRKYQSRKGIQKYPGYINVPLEEDKSLRRLAHHRTRSDSQLLRKRSSRTYRQIFAILTFIRRPEELRSFMEAGVCDADLPLEEVEEDKLLRQTFDLRRRSAHDVPLPCFRSWQEGDMRQFADFQRIVLAPRFENSEDGSVPHFQFLQEEIMPFSWKPLATGGFGQVYEASIHPDYHDFDRTLVRDLPGRKSRESSKRSGKSKKPYDVIAVKRLHLRGAAETKKAFDQEAGVLRNLSCEGHRHSHLIRLLATYEQSGNYFLIFPWADSDLETFWERTKPEAGMANWIIEQCYGLASGLSHVHRYMTKSNTTMSYQQLASLKTSPTARASLEDLKLLGRHGDIKPTNILWFRDGSRYGILKITDFGIAQFTVNNTKDTARQKGRVPNSPTYRSPECDIPDAPISSQCDIWALGCVYLVFTAWFFGGWDSVTSFADSRKRDGSSFRNSRPYDEHGAFFTMVEHRPGARRAEVKDSVLTMIRKGYNHKNRTPQLCKLLKHVRDDMLVIQGPELRGYLQVPNQPIKRRISSGNLATELSSLSEKFSG